MLTGHCCVGRIIAWCRVGWCIVALLVCYRFEVLRGVPKAVLAERMGYLNGGVVTGQVVPTPDYVRFATAFGFDPTSVSPQTRNRRGSWST